MSETKVLVVDDEENIRSSLTETLTEAGYEVKTALNGEAALEKARETEPELILLEVELPGIDGLEVLRRLDGTDSEVIMITDSGSVETAVESMKLGASDYLQKPFSNDEILEQVNEVLDRSKLVELDLKNTDYETCVEQAREMIEAENLNRATKFLKLALAHEPTRPEPFNLLGAIAEMNGETTEALKKYRAALALDSAYEPAEKNLERATQLESTPEGITLDGEAESEAEADT